MKSLNVSHVLKTFSHLWVQQLSSHCERDHCIWQFFEHCLCLLFQSLYSLCDDECTHQDHSCVSVMWESLNRVHNKLKSKILQTEKEQARLFAKLSWLHKMLRQTQDCAKQKTLCLLKKMSNLILSPSLLKVLKCSHTTVEIFYEFSCVFRGVVPLSLDKIVSFSANHSFF